MGATLRARRLEICVIDLRTTIRAMDKAVRFRGEPMLIQEIEQIRLKMGI